MSSNKIILFIALLLTGCNNSYLEDIDRGADYNFNPGYPELRLITTSFIDENDSTKIMVWGDIVYGSLIYTRQNEIFQANTSINVRIVKDDKNHTPVKRKTYSQKIVDKDFNITNSQEVFKFQKIYDVPPGEYIVYVSITDEASKKQTLVKSNTSIPSPEVDEAHISEISILAKDTDKDSVTDEFSAITTYDIPSRFDSLKFYFQVTNNNPDEPITIYSRLIKFKADDSIARSMGDNDYSASDISYKGIEYDKSEVIQSSNRVLDQTGSVFIEFTYTNLEQGNYRFEVSEDPKFTKALYKARDFSSKSENYPAILSARELAKPLYYLMSNKEYKNLMAIKSSDSLKKEIDRFWLRNIKDSRIAKEVISLYYQRVEEANKKFSNFKEGWKTDPGMVYILFGPPWYDDAFSGQMMWSYTYNMNDSNKNFLFTTYKRKTKFYPFKHYLLKRSSDYYNLNYQQVQKWKSELILTEHL